MNKKKIIEIIILTEALVITFIGFPMTLFRLLQYKLDERVEIFREASPNGECELVIWRIGVPGPFGVEQLDFSLYNKTTSDNNCSYPTEFSADVANDGGTGAYRIEWLDDCVQITLSGDEQEDAMYILPFP